jgi:hypothetical protein
MHLYQNKGAVMKNHAPMFIKRAENNNNASLFLFRAPERIFLGIFSHTGALYQNMADGFFITAPFIRIKIPAPVSTNRALL